MKFSAGVLWAHSSNRLCATFIVLLWVLWISRTAQLDLFWTSLHHSVNEYISREEFACKYSLFDEATEMVRELGADALMYKIDIKNAFKLCPVRMEDWGKLFFKWQGSYYCYIALPFGSRLIHSSNIIHYLDDFFLAEATFHECQMGLDSVVDISKFLNVPLAENKLIPPTTSIVYLGILIDSHALTISLPDDKLVALKNTLQEWMHKHSCTKRELLSLIGSLSFATKVIQPGRIFLRRLIDLSTSVNSLSDIIYMSEEALRDIDFFFFFFTRLEWT